MKPKVSEQQENGDFNMEPKTYILESIIAILVLIIITLISILLTTEVEGLGSIVKPILEILTLIMISLTAFFTLKSAKAARDSAEASSTNIELMRQSEIRKIKPFLAIEFGKVELKTGKISEVWDQEGNIIKVLVLNSSLAADVFVHIEVKNITEDFRKNLSEVGVDVGVAQQVPGLNGSRIFIKSNNFSSWAEIETKSFESVLTREIKSGCMLVKIPEVFIYLMNTYFKSTNRVEIPYLEINIKYSDFEGNNYHDIWNLYCENITGPLGSNEKIVTFKPIKR